MIQRGLLYVAALSSIVHTLEAATVVGDTALVNNGQYSAYFRVACGNAPVGVSAAAATCASYGQGWALAAINSAAANSAVAALSAQRILTSGSDAGHEGTWVWKAGRLQGQTFFEAGRCRAGFYCFWSQGQPDNYRGGQNDLTIWDTNAFTSRQWDDASADVDTACFACERSPCDVAVDCVAGNTAAVNTTRYYETGQSCACVCKPGFNGTRCEVGAFGAATVVGDTALVNNGQYSAYFRVACGNAPVGVSAAAATCASYGQGWALAAINSAAANSAVAALSAQRILTCGSDAGHEGTWVWKAGRLQGQTFFEAGRCRAGFYCFWSQGQPDNYRGGQNDLTIWDTNAFTSRQWDDASADVDAACFACERSPCDIAVDCVAGNTAAVNTTRYYETGQSCACVCKPGFNGTRCEVGAFGAATVVGDTALVSNGQYSAYFRVACGNAPVGVSAAAATCASYGQGWALAAINSAAANSAVAALSAQRILTSGSDAGHEGTWVWKAGRLQGQTFFEAGRCRAGFYCFWSQGQPDNYRGGQNDLTIWDTNAFTSRQWDDASADVDTACFACERSPCDIAVDCVAGNTATVNTTHYYQTGQSCECVCKPGFSHCEKPQAESDSRRDVDTGPPVAVVAGVVAAGTAVVTLCVAGAALALFLFLKRRNRRTTPRSSAIVAREVAVVVTSNVDYIHSHGQRDGEDGTVMGIVVEFEEDNSANDAHYD